MELGSLDGEIPQLLTGLRPVYFVFLLSKLEPIILFGLSTQRLSKLAQLNAKK